MGYEELVGYEEQTTAVRDAVLWQRVTGPSPSSILILPDGCLDLIWDGRRLFVAGPDATARRHWSPGAARYVGLRFSAGLGPALLGVPAHELRDQTVELDQFWPSGTARRLTEQVAVEPAGALHAWLTETVTARRTGPMDAMGRTGPMDPMGRKGPMGRTGPMDSIGPRVLAMAAAGVPVVTMAERVGLSARQLHRRCLSLFGYGPRHLARVLRLGRALDQVRANRPLAQVAADCGYCDQAHLSREVQALVGTTPSRWVAGSTGGAEEPRSDWASATRASDVSSHLTRG